MRPWKSARDLDLAIVPDGVHQGTRLAHPASALLAHDLQHRFAIAGQLAAADGVERDGWRGGYGSPATADSGREGRGEGRDDLPRLT